MKPYSFKNIRFETIRILPNPIFGGGLPLQDSKSSQMDPGHLSLTIILLVSLFLFFYLCFAT
ncbi:MAG TPA: hypothetical protein DDW18_01395 [Firmicutes bacterium]|nr:hypothetical protein [Bacillota bacterium]